MAKKRPTVRRPKPDFNQLPDTTILPAPATVQPPSVAKNVTPGDLLSEIKSGTARQVEIDVTPFLNISEGEKRVLIWKCPSVTEMYRIGKDGQKLLEQNPLWEPQLALDVATFGACHVAPLSPKYPPGLLYAGIAKSESPLLWLYLVERLAMEFPHLSNNPASSYDKLFDACAELFHKHPSMLNDLSSESAQELIEAYERKKARHS